MFILPANIYLFKVNKKNTREKCKIYWKLTTAGPGKKGMHAIFQKIGKKGQNDVKKEQKRAKYSKILYKNWKYFEKGQVIINYNKLLEKALNRHQNDVIKVTIIHLASKIVHQLAMEYLFLINNK